MRRRDLFHQNEKGITLRIFNIEDALQTVQSKQKVAGHSYPIF